MQNMKLDMQQFIKNLESNGVIIKNKKINWLLINNSLKFV